MQTKVDKKIISPKMKQICEHVTTMNLNQFINYFDQINDIGLLVLYVLFDRNKKSICSSLLFSISK